MCLCLCVIVWCFYACSLFAVYNANEHKTNKHNTGFDTTMKSTTKKATGQDFDTRSNVSRRSNQSTGSQRFQKSWFQKDIMLRYQIIYLNRSMVKIKIQSYINLLKISQLLYLVIFVINLIGLKRYKDKMQLFIQLVFQMIQALS